ncbi:MAG: hypothetical protein ABEJ08_02245 [Halobacteriaceae archaeon]
MDRPDPGILDLVSLAVTVAFAAPVGLYGASELAAGDATGAVYIGIAALFFALRALLTTPEDVPIAVVQRLAGAVARDPEDDATEE